MNITPAVAAAFFRNCLRLDMGTFLVQSIIDSLFDQPVAAGVNVEVAAADESDQCHAKSQRRFNRKAAGSAHRDDDWDAGRRLRAETGAHRPC